MKPLIFAPSWELPLRRAVALVFLLAMTSRAEPGSAPLASKAIDPQEVRAMADELSVLPSRAERAALLQRQREFNAVRQGAKIMVFPVRIGTTADSECAVELAKLLTRSWFCQSCGVARPVVLAAAPPEPGDAFAWTLARAFRAQLIRNPPGTDYALYASYTLSPNEPKPVAIVFVLCNAQGDWVVVDRQELTNGQPASKRDCDELVARRLTSLFSEIMDESSCFNLRAAFGQPTVALASQPAQP